MNVALRHWRFLYKLRAPAVRYFDGEFGWSCNIRQPMTAAFTHSLNPDEPIVLTFYTGIFEAGRPAKEQGDEGRKKLLSTPYADYEFAIRRQLRTMFTASGFDASADIRGIVLNRWGHARVIQPPGFYYGANGKPSPRQIVERGFGKIAIAHSEVNGHQNATGALAQGKRGVEQLATLG